ncbi:MAG: GrdX family protein, partial [Firmicutes bacterium]|nr:GrdX family protein [Bacillota bacterium]
HNVIYLDVSYEEVLLEVRNRIHQGAQLLSHPLSGSVKPGETPYKSVLVSKTKGKTDIESLEIIEKAIETCRKFPIRWKDFKDEVIEDFKLVDYTLISSAVDSADA